MASNIKISATSTYVAPGKPTLYTFHVIKDGQNQGPPYMTVSPEDAKSWFNDKKKEVLAQDPNAQLNDSPLSSSDPFTDQSFIDTAEDVSAGGFEEVASRDARMAAMDIDGDGLDDMDSPPDLEERALTGQELLKKYPEVANAPGPNALSSLGGKISQKAQDYNTLDRNKKKVIDGVTHADKHKLNLCGVFNAPRVQTRVIPKKCGSENWALEGVDNNAFIVVGNDRPFLPHTGYGGKAHTQCDSIDIIVGMGGHNPIREIQVPVEATSDTQTTFQTKEIETNPNFFLDAARIYISQKTDVDKNFGIGEFGRSRDYPPKIDYTDEENIGKYGGKSAVAAKADNIRLIGRESIRLVTGTDEINSKGGRVLGKHGIELVAMNKVEDLQPLVLGNNLELALNAIVDNIIALAKIFEAFVHYQMKYNRALQKHKHKTQFYGLDSLPSSEAITGGIQCDVETVMNTETSIVKHITNLQGLIINFLSPANAGGKKPSPPPTYILSKHNKTT
tara:strand:- start:41415 stop:42929 length:1515 start_codon:yes stop_codon:yes gene_type:complete